MNSEYLIELRSVTKSFGNVNAVDGISFGVRPGEVVGLIGDNGAGKSTLIKILSGVHQPDSGQIIVRGREVRNWNAAKSRESGIETVYQDRALAPQQTITRNIFMGREIKNRLGVIKVKTQYEEANRLMREIGFTSKVFDPDSPVATLSGGQVLGNTQTYFEAAGLEAGQVKAIGFDTNEFIMQGFADNWIHLTADQQPFLQGYLPVLSICQTAKFGLAPLNADTGAGFIDVSNYEQVKELAIAGYR